MGNNTEGVGFNFDFPNAERSKRVTVCFATRNQLNVNNFVFIDCSIFYDYPRCEIYIHPVRIKSLQERKITLHAGRELNINCFVSAASKNAEKKEKRHATKQSPFNLP